MKTKYTDPLPRKSRPLQPAVSQQQQQQQPLHKRRRPPPKRCKPGSKRPRTIFNLDDIVTVAPPEFPKQQQNTPPNGSRSGTTGERNQPQQQQPQEQEQQRTGTLDRSSSSSSQQTSEPVVVGHESQLAAEAILTEKNTIATDIAPEIRAEIPPQHRKQQEKDPPMQSSTIAIDNNKYMDPDDSSGSNDNDDDDDPNQIQANGNTNHRGPWFTRRENQHMLEDWVMGKLDTMITKAERREERALMEHFDEQILMQQLLRNINQASEGSETNSSENAEANGPNENDSQGCVGEATEKDSDTETSSEEDCRKERSERPEPPEPPSIPTGLVAEKEMERDHGMIEVPKTSTGPTKNAATAVGSGADVASAAAPPLASSDDSDERIESPGTIVIRRAVPKWIPGASGNDSARVRLFTPEEFNKCVIRPLNYKIPDKPLDVRLLEDFPGDEDSYLLECRACNNSSSNREAQKKAWKHLRGTAEAYVHCKIAGINLKNMLEDGASLQLDLVLSINKPLGLSFSKFTIVWAGSVAFSDTDGSGPPGLWVKRTAPGMGIANALGSHSALDHGCALLSVDGIILRDPVQLKHLMEEAKAQKDSANCVSVKLCLSRHADLTEIPHSKLFKSFRLSRRDGRPIDPSLYSGLPEDPDATSTSPALPAESSPADKEKNSGLSRSLPSSENRNGPPPSPTLDAEKARKSSIGDTDETDREENAQKCSSPTSKKRSGPPPNPPLEAKKVRESPVGEVDKEDEAHRRSPPASKKDVGDSTIGKLSKRKGTSAPPLGCNSDAATESDSDMSVSSCSHRDTPTKSANSLPELADANTKRVDANSTRNDNKGQPERESASLTPVIDNCRPTYISGENVDRFPLPTSKPVSTSDRRDSRGETKTDVDNSTTTSTKNASTRSDKALLQLGQRLNSAPAQPNPKRRQAFLDSVQPGQRRNRSPPQLNANGRPAYSDTAQPNQMRNSAPVQAQQRGHTDHRNSVSSRFDHFEVALDPTRPLGGFFRTERGQNFIDKCVLFSRHAGGQLDSDARIKVGTQVIAVMVGERRTNIFGFADLSKHYRDAKQHRKNLRLILKNNHSCRIESAHVSNSNWSSSGAWIGNEEKGWAGGASCNDKNSIGTETTSNRKGATAGPSSVGAGVSRSEWDPIPSEERRCSMGSFDPKSGCFSPSSLMDYEAPPANASVLPGEETFKDVIRNKSWKELIDVVERGPEFTKEFVQQVLMRECSYAGSELKKSNFSASTGDESGFRKPLWERLQDEREKRRRAEVDGNLEAKKKILKLYANSAHLIEGATTLRNWTEIEIEVTSLQLFHLSSKSAPGRSRVINVKARSISPDSLLCHLPVESSRPRISYASNNKFSVHNNFVNALFNRKVVVEVSEGDPKLDKAQPKKLGEFVLALNEIEKQCSSEGHRGTIEKRLENFGVLGISVKRRSSDKDYVGTKRQEILNRLETQLESIERFNDEYCNDETPARLTSNVRGIHGISLLYASIEIMADQKLVQRMLSLGCDPRQSPSPGSRARCSPLDLARKHYDRCKKKARDAWESGKPGARQASAQKSAEVKQLLEMLEAAKSK